MLGNSLIGDLSDPLLVLPKGGILLYVPVCPMSIADVIAISRFRFRPSYQV
jgi:hypothetical protein